jgi:hypothetical protein
MVEKSTIGRHPRDVERLQRQLHKLVKVGNSRNHIVIAQGRAVDLTFDFGIGNLDRKPGPISLLSSITNRA